MRRTSPAQLALIDLPTAPADDDVVVGGARADGHVDDEVATAAARARRERQQAINVAQCQALLDTIARVPPAGAVVPSTRPSARPRRRAHVEERRIRQLAELYAAFERAGAPGEGAAAAPAANDDRRQRGRGSRVA